MKTRESSWLVALVAFLLIMALGESVALLEQYQNNVFFRQYLSENSLVTTGETLVLIFLGIGLASLAYRRSSIPPENKGPGPFSNLGMLELSFFSDSFHLFVRSMKKLIRNPILVFFSLFQPVIFLVLFTQLFSKFGQLLGPGFSYTTFATAGIVLQNAFSSAFQSGTAVVDDIKSGFLTKMLATPVNRSAILMGRILSDVFRVVVQTVIILGLAYLLGVYPATGILGYLLIIFAVAFFGLAWSGISLALGLRTKSAETVFGIAGFLTFPLLFMSTALVKQRFMPDWMQTVSAYNPISFAVNAIRNLIMGYNLDLTVYVGFDWSTILQAFGVIAAIGVVTLGATLYLFRKVVS